MIAAYRALPPALRGIVMMLVATFCFTAMHALIRLTTAEIHPFVVAFYRNLFGLLVLVPILVRAGPGVFRTTKLHLHGARAALQMSAMLSFFYALSITPLAEVAALAFSSPLFVTVIAILILGEVIRIRRIAALAAGIAGTLIIVRPGIGSVDPGALAVLGSSAAWGSALIIIKVASRTDSSLTITAYMAILVTPMALIPALFFWSVPDLATLGWFALLGAFGTAGHFCMAQALKEADATTVMPFDFTRLIWASVLGVLIFGEYPDLWTWVGGSVIFASTVYIAYRETQVKREPPLTSGPVET